MQTESLFCPIPATVCERIDAEFRNRHLMLLPAELLIFLLSATSTKPTRYTGTIEGADGIPTERQWTISWADRYGAPTPSTIRTFVALYRIWKDVDFESREIIFDMAVIIERSDGNTREQIEADLHKLLGASISYKNGGFGLFDSVAIGRTKGCMSASQALHHTVRNEYFLLDKWSEMV
jgi:hypothetical protein